TRCLTSGTTAASDSYTLSLHDALPILGAIIGNKAGNTAVGAIAGAAIGGVAGGLIGNKMDKQAQEIEETVDGAEVIRTDEAILVDRKSTRLNSSHVKISYAVFCLKKKT